MAGKQTKISHGTFLCSPESLLSVEQFISSFQIALKSPLLIQQPVFHCRSSHVYLSNESKSQLNRKRPYPVNSAPELMVRHCLTKGARALHRTHMCKFPPCLRDHLFGWCILTSPWKVGLQFLWGNCPRLGENVTGWKYLFGTPHTW